MLLKLWNYKQAAIFTTITKYKTSKVSWTLRETGEHSLTCIPCQWFPYEISMKLH